MPSQLGNLQIASAALRSRTEAQARVGHVVLRGQPPWIGFAPDLPATVAGMTGFRSCNGLIAQTFSTRGIVLRPDEGFVKHDPTPTKLPLGSAVLPSASPRAIIRLDSFYRTNTIGGRSLDEDLTLMAITEGDLSVGSSRLYRLNPQTNTWSDAITYSGAINAATASRNGISDTASATARSMPDTTTVPFGISGTVAAPVWVWCNNRDPVYIYPNAVGVGGTYTDYPSGALSPFVARSCCVWIGRVWFLNTSEAVSRFSQRLRRSAALNGQIDPTVAGTGTLDFRDFDGEGMAVRPLGDHLAVYFADGVGLVLRPAEGQPPVNTRVITKERGLLGTHAVVAIGPAEHFGLFTDGFFILDAAGQFTEVGLLNVQNGQPQHTFRDTFFEQLDDNRVNEIQVAYQQKRYVRIAWPHIAGSTVVWTYDVHTGAMWPMDWTATCFANFPNQASTAGTIDGLDALAGTIDALDSVSATIDALGQTSFGARQFLHGDEGGFVYHKDSTTYLRNGIQASWGFETHYVGGDSLSRFMVLDKAVLSYIGGGTAVATIHGVAAQLIEGGDQLKIAEVYLRTATRRARFQISGTGDIRIEAFEQHLRTAEGDIRS